MNHRCDHCGEPALGTDTVCWHCGMPLPGRQEVDAKRNQVKKGRQQALLPSTVALYAGMTIVVSLGALLLMIYLGRLPLVQVRFGTRTPDQWVSIVSADNGFILNLPENWWWLDGAGEGQRIEVNDRVAADRKFNLGTYPFGAEVNDLEIQFIAGTSPPSGLQRAPFLVIGRSSLLNRLTYDEAIDFLLTSDYHVREVRFVDDFDKSHVSIIVQTDLVEDLVLRCRQQFILGQSRAMLVSLCAPTSQMPAHTNTFEDILSSFQRLNS